MQSLMLYAALFVASKAWFTFVWVRFAYTDSVVVCDHSRSCQIGTKY